MKASLSSLPARRQAGAHAQGVEEQRARRSGAAFAQGLPHGNGGLAGQQQRESRRAGRLARGDEQLMAGDAALPQARARIAGVLRVEQLLRRRPDEVEEQELRRQILNLNVVVEEYVALQVLGQGRGAARPAEQQQGRSLAPHFHPVEHAAVPAGEDRRAAFVQAGGHHVVGGDALQQIEGAAAGQAQPGLVGAVQQDGPLQRRPPGGLLRAEAQRDAVRREDGAL